MRPRRRMQRAPPGLSLPRGGTEDGRAVGWDGRAAFAELGLSIAAVLLSLLRQFESLRTSDRLPRITCPRRGRALIC
eukprot:370389-Hanusia_phi.AAC.1